MTGQDSSLIQFTEILIPGIVTAVVTSYITVKLAIRRFHEERWWEKKEKSYSRLIMVLHRFKSITHEYYADEYVPTHLLSEDDKLALNEEWKKTNQKLIKLRDIASFHLSDDAISILDEYENRVRKRPKPGFDRLQRVKDHLEAAEQCLERLKEAAKRDLKVK
jgi:hypothetical protein